ncbi:MAG TPA: biopolymer transporter ExbD [Gammaproteobacteria bacterium]
MIYMGRASRIVRNHQMKKKHVVINLVAMIDMLTVLVFFLLVYSTEQITVVPDRKEVQLPQSIAETQITNTVVVIVGEHEIIVHGRPVARIDEVLADGDAVIPALQAELMADATDMVRLAALPEEERIALRKVTIMADKELPFLLLREVMATSTAAGYGQLSLAVLQKASDLAFETTVASND